MNRLVVVSNRVPVPSLGTQAGGLAVALGDLMTTRGGLWFGWSGSVSDDAARKGITVERNGRAEYATVDLTQDEHDRYYNNFSNSVLWPLLHTMPELVSFDRRDAQAYREVNARLADTLAPLIRPGDLIWVHDYHLVSLPAQLRARGITNPIGFFLHIPFANSDVLTQVPEVGGLIRELLAADLIGFQTTNDAENFAAAAQSIAGATLVADDCLQHGAHRARLGVFPVEIEAREFAATAAEAWAGPETERLRKSLGRQLLILGVDRLDPTKGLLQRLAGMRRLLEKQKEWQRKITYLQIAAVSRKEVDSYRDLRETIDQEAGNLNTDFADPDWAPLRLIAKAAPRDIMGGYMRQAQVGFVTPLRDGMNLVAKEFVAAQDPQHPGVLVLSRFAGAARQLDAAVLVNPHDPDDMADGLDRALRMPLAERQDRWQAMWRAIEAASPQAWGRSFLAELLRTASVRPPPGDDEAPLRVPPKSELSRRFGERVGPSRLI